MSSPDPNPYLRPQEPTLGPAPVPVMEQIFWIELAQPPEIATEIETPPGVTLLDRTKPGTDRTRTRLYFRSDRGIEHGEIIVKSPNHEPVRIPLHVRTYRQDIEEQTRTISDLDPTARKCGPSYYTDDIISRAKENLRNLTDREPEQPSEAAHRENQLSPKEVLSRLTPYDNLSDEELFQTLPAWNIPRSCYSNWPCPHCGTAIFQDSGYYPWKLEPEHPYKARCPKCKQLFPSNNFSTDDLTSGNHPDDG
ncbi:MAG: hypothetical protein O2954_10930, partial [bacterium]|nr:hypothetical protein [bacterium]